MTDRSGRMAETVQVDLSREDGIPNYCAAGFLHGIKDSVPDEMIRPLKLRLERTGKANTWQQAERLKALGIEQQLIIEGWGWGEDKEHPGDNGRWDRWEALVSNVVTETKARGITVQWDLWNEPDYIYFWRRSPEQFDETWKRAYRVVRKLDPDAIIAGPGWSGEMDVYSARFRQFLEFCKENDVAPDYFCWHFPKDTVAEAKYIRDLLAELQIEVKGLMVAEYCFEENMYCGRTVWEIAQLERANIEYACRASWWSPLGGILADPKQGTPKGLWWAYKRYADITGTLVHTEPSEHIDLVAGIDDKTETALVLLGNKGSAARASSGTFTDAAKGDLERGADSSGTVTVRLTGLGKAPWLLKDGKLRVFVERLPGGDGAVESPPVVMESEMGTNGDSLDIMIPWDNERDAFAIQLGNVSR